MKQGEDVIQAAVYLWYNNNYTVKGLGICFSIPNGGTRNIAEAVKLKATGLMAGASDLMLNHNGKWYCIELKKPGGVQSPDQKKFQARIEALGTEYKIIYSLDEFKEWLIQKG